VPGAAASHTHAACNCIRWLLMVLAMQVLVCRLWGVGVDCVSQGLNNVPSSGAAAGGSCEVKYVC
jgi:hypothetical protein